MNDLILEYNKTLELTTSKINGIKEALRFLDERLENAEDAQIVDIKSEIANLKVQKDLYSSCKSDLNYTIYWMEHGHAPGATRGIERRAVYEREIAIDPFKLQLYYSIKQPEMPWEVSDHDYSILDKSEKELIEYALNGLTNNEREMYYLFVAKGMSQYKIADMLYVTRNTVKTTLSRAKRKISVNVVKYKEMRGDLEHGIR